LWFKGFIPLARLLFLLKSLDQVKKPIFYFVMKLVYLLVLLGWDLLGLSKAFVARMEFSARAERNVQEIQILSETPSTIAFSNIPGDAVSGVNTVCSDSLEMGRKLRKYLAGEDIECYSILPYMKLLKPSIYVPAFQPSNTPGWKNGMVGLPIFHHSAF
jgi:hypothetical protein